ncbi:hypothetical protein BDW72DRAFT_157939 [Aspergillus terricola var. indicus]
METTQRQNPSTQPRKAVKERGCKKGALFEACDFTACAVSQAKQGGPSASGYNSLGALACSRVCFLMFPSVEGCLFIGYPLRCRKISLELMADNLGKMPPTACTLLYMTLHLSLFIGITVLVEWPRRFSSPPIRNRQHAR